MQMPIMKDVLRAMNIPIYECQGWEADDVIGTVGKICSAEGWECVIVTGDRDSLQLIDENVHVKLVISKPGQTTATLYDEARFREEYGFEPKKLIDLKALMGDSSDNIPGVAGVGPKTAGELLQKFGSLDGVYANLQDASIRPKLREKLEGGKESAYLSYELATIRPEAPIDFAPRDAIVQPYNRPELYKLFQKLEFVRLIDKYGLRGAEAAAPAAAEAVPETLPRLEAVPQNQEEYALYLAGDGSLGLACREGVCALTPMEAGMGVSFAGKKLILHDSKATMHRLDEMGIPFGECVFDTALAAYDLKPLDEEGISEEELEARKALWVEALSYTYNYHAHDFVQIFGMERTIEHYNYSRDINVITEQRPKKLLFGRMLMEDSPFSARLFGVELARFTVGQNNYDVENDLHGIYFLYGAVGLGAMCLFLLYFIGLIAKALIRDFRRYFTLEAASWGVALVCCLLHVYNTAGVLRRPNASFYLAAVLAAVYYLVKLQKTPKETR